MDLIYTSPHLWWSSGDLLVIFWQSFGDLLVPSGDLLVIFAPAENCSAHEKKIDYAVAVYQTL